MKRHWYRTQRVIFVSLLCILAGCSPTPADSAAPYGILSMQEEAFLQSLRKAGAGRAAPVLFTCADFDGDGQAEAFAAYRRKEQDALWFCDGGGARLIEEGLPSGAREEILSIGDARYYQLIWDAGDEESFSLYHAAANGVQAICSQAPGFLAFDALNQEREQNKADSFPSNPPALLYRPQGERGPVYYLYEDGGLKEYGGIEIDEATYNGLDGLADSSPLFSVLDGFAKLHDAVYTVSQPDAAPQPGAGASGTAGNPAYRAQPPPASAQARRLTVQRILYRANGIVQISLSLTDESGGAAARTLVINGGKREYEGETLPASGVFEAAFPSPPPTGEEQEAREERELEERRIEMWEGFKPQDPAGRALTPRAIEIAAQFSGGREAKAVCVALDDYDHDGSEEAFLFASRYPIQMRELRQEGIFGDGAPSGEVWFYKDGAFEQISADRYIWQISACDMGPASVFFISGGSMSEFAIFGVTDGKPVTLGSGTGLLRAGIDGTLLYASFELGDGDKRSNRWIGEFPLFYDESTRSIMEYLGQPMRKEAFFSFDGGREIYEMLSPGDTDIPILYYNNGRINIGGCILYERDGKLSLQSPAHDDLDSRYKNISFVSFSQFDAYGSYDTYEIRPHGSPFEAVPGPKRAQGAAREATK